MKAIKWMSVCLAVVAVLIVMGSMPAMATTHTVNSTEYTKNTILDDSEDWDAYELTATSGQHVSYSVTVNSTGDCAQLFFAKGHGFGLASDYYVHYSQENCVTSYSNDFPVGSSDGTKFTIAIITTRTHDVWYTVVIKTYSPAIPDWVLGLIVVIIIIVVVALIKVMLRRRKAKAAMPPPQSPQEPQLPPQ